MFHTRFGVPKLSRHGLRSQEAHDRALDSKLASPHRTTSLGLVRPGASFPAYSSIEVPGRQVLAWRMWRARSHRPSH